MASYKVVVDKRVRKKDLPRIPQKLAKAVVQRIAALAEDPFPADSVQLKGRRERRIRQGDYRILYIVEEDIVTVFVIQIGHRREVYR
jgi:mRNA interferase RelE/StbE